MIKEFNDNEIAHLKTDMEVEFKNNEVLEKRLLEKDTPVRIIKSKKIPKAQGSVGYYVAIDDKDMEIESVLVVPESNFYTKIEIEKIIRDRELIEKIRKYINININVELRCDDLERFYSEIESSLVVLLTEESVWEVIKRTTSIINKESITDVNEVIEVFNVELDRELPF